MIGTWIEFLRFRECVMHSARGCAAEDKGGVFVQNLHIYSGYRNPTLSSFLVAFRYSILLDFPAK